MSQTFLIDTVAAIEYLNGNQQVLHALPRDSRVLIPFIVVGELYAGAEKSARVDENRSKMQDFVFERRILYADLETAKYYDRIVAALRKKGRPIPQNDVWIAALSVQHGLTLLTRDAHFQQVDGLAVQGW